MKNTLVALALVKTLWDTRRKDHLDAFLPLLALILQRHKISEFRDLRPLQRHFWEDWGLVIPYHAVASIVNRARKRGLVSRSAATYYPVLHRLREEASESRAEDRRTRVTGMLSSFATFAATLGVELSPAEAEGALIGYLRRHSSNLHLLSGTESPLPDVQTSDQSLYLFASFANHAQVSQPEDFRTLLEVWFGHAIINALVFPEIESLRGKLSRLTLYLDAPVVFNALGYSGSEAQDSSLELLTEAKRNGARLAIFHHTYDEVFGILESTVPWLTDLRAYDPTKASATLRHFVDAGFRPSDVEQILATLPRRIQDLSAKLEAAPKAVENVKYQIDETKLDEIIRTIYRSTPTDYTIQRDIDSIAGIYRLRRDRLPRSITETDNVFLTTNHSLAMAGRRYELSYVSDSFFIPAAITDVFLGTIIWLESPQALEKLNRLQLLSDVQDLLEPKESLLRRFGQAIHDLATRGEISADEFLLLRTSQVARSLLQEITLGDPLNFSHRTAEEILHQIKEGVRDEERLVAQGLIGQLQNSFLAEQAAKFEAIAQSDRVHARIERFSQRVGRVIAGLVFVALALTWVGVFALITLATDATGWKKTVAVVATVLLSAASLVVPMVDALSLSSKLRSRIAGFVKQRMLDREDPGEEREQNA